MQVEIKNIKSGLNSYNLTTADIFPAKTIVDNWGAVVRSLAQACYENSTAQGLGFLHYTEDSEFPENPMDYACSEDGNYSLRLDYVAGRACKLGFYLSKDHFHFNMIDHYGDLPIQILKAGLSKAGLVVKEEDMVMEEV